MRLREWDSPVTIPTDDAASCPCLRLGRMEPGEKQNKDFIAFTLLGKKCPPKKLGITGLIVKHLQKTFQRPISLQLPSPMAVSQCCTGSCPNLVMSKHEVHEEKGGEALQPGTHRSLCLVPSAGGDDSSSMLAPQDWQGALQVQMEVAESRGAAHSTESLVQTSISCAHRSPPLPCPVGSPSKTKLTSHFSLFSTLSSGSETDSSPMPPASSKKYLRGSWKKNSHPEEPTSLKPRGLACSLFTGPIIARITDCIYLGNLNAAYSGRALCTNSIDSIIDMSSLPSDCSLSVIPCTCQRGGFKHSWSRLKVDIQAPLHGDNHDMGQPCFRHINNCIEASLEKGKRVLIHCRDGYSLGPTCVIQYLMVKHSMRLLAAYELVRARYPLNIQECHQDLLVGLEMSLQPGSINIMCLKHSLSRKMAWS
ncbi:troponin I, fast skeletal muscle [Patagioenas fasciata monilis]|uniref:protein-tyrosine-phosphatase n=2 Tax=Patagioenas fasciata TaxID=372321 RepID=A0A1V4JNJ8_PATFA|nr:troponin I, fast skeletal muscle [Patagioenas fasciata monilis]